MIGSRKSNEDSVFPLHPKTDDSLFIVSDGVGGGGNGQTASQLCNHLTERFFSRVIKPITKNTFQKLHEYIQEGFKRFKSGHIEYEEMATTTCILQLNKMDAHIAWAGDSRVYLVRDHKLIYQTKDHSLVEQIKSRSELNDNIFPPKDIHHLITNCLSANYTSEYLEHHEFKEIVSGDIFLLCSDGVYNSFGEGKLKSILCSKSSTAEKEKAIAKHCLEFASDNYSFILVKV